MSNNHCSLKEKIFSADILPKIFKFLTSPKDKVRIERVSRKFRQFAQSVEAWSNVKSIVFDKASHEYIHILINGDPISLKYISSAIQSLFFRNRNVEAILVVECQTPVVYSAIIDTIMQLGVFSFPNLAQLHLHGDEIAENSVHIKTLINTFRNQLKVLCAYRLRFENAAAAAEWWKMVGKCVHLKTVRFIPGCTTCDTTSAEMVKSALRGKAIETFNFFGSRITADKLSEIICSFNKTWPLRYLTFGGMCFQSCFSLRDFADRLPAFHWANLQEIHYAHRIPMLTSEPAWTVLLRLPQMCPQLQRLKLHGLKDTFTPSLIVDLIVAYLFFQNNSNALSISADIIVTVLPRFYGKARDALLESLVKDYNCAVHICDDDFGEERYRIQLGKQGCVYADICSSAAPH